MHKMTGFGDLEINRMESNDKMGQPKEERVFWSQTCQETKDWMVRGWRSSSPRVKSVKDGKYEVQGPKMKNLENGGS